jgi:hypothetical protein
MSPTPAPAKTGTYADANRLRAVTPAGRYALEDTDPRTGESTLRFIIVDKPTTGKWKGYTFVKEQAGPTFYAVRDLARIIRFLGAISADPLAATVRYGHELGVCGMCGRALTNKESRDAGIGPVCAALL